MLLVSLASVSFDFTDTKFSTVPLSITSTTKVKIACAFLSKSPTDQTLVTLSYLAPPKSTTLTKPLKDSVTVTLVAFEGPLLTTSMV